MTRRRHLSLGKAEGRVLIGKSELNTQKTLILSELKKQ
jgi:hypothetical protein